MKLVIGATDSAGAVVQLSAPLIHGNFQVEGTVTLAAGAPSEPLAGIPVVLKGMGLGLNATTTLDSAGRFTFDSLPADTCQVDVSSPGGLYAGDFADVNSATTEWT
jgi:hypothetical protein